MENNCQTLSSFSEELLLESQKLCSQLENVMHDTMKDQEQSFMVKCLVFSHLNCWHIPCLLGVGATSLGSQSFYAKL